MRLTHQLFKGFRTVFAGEHQIGHVAHSTVRLTSYRKAHLPNTMRCRPSLCWQASLTIDTDGPSRMVKRPTESGGEPSSSNCGASAGVKARQLTHLPHDTLGSPLSALRLAGAGHGTTSPPRINHWAGQPGARAASGHCRTPASRRVRGRPSAGSYAAPRSGLSWTRHLLLDRRCSSLIQVTDPQFKWSGARRWRLRAWWGGSQVQLI